MSDTLRILGGGDGTAFSRAEIGGKAYSVHSMLRRGLPVPPAFTLPTSLCGPFHADRDGVLAGIRADLVEGIALLEETLQRRFGDPAEPLLVSVRSGAARSMPGMMDTVLNLGVTPEVAAGLSARHGAQFGDDVLRRYGDQYRNVVGIAPTGDLFAQLEAAVCAVFDSWYSPRAVAYRKHHGLSDDGGTAVTVQAMVFGNHDADSGTGVLFSRNPITGDRAPYGEWLPGAQGEDVVSGRFDPLPIANLRDVLPSVHEQLIDAAQVLEREFGDVQDIEFTVERGRLWLLQSRAAKRSATAAISHAIALHAEGVIDAEEVFARVDPAQLTSVLSPHLDELTRAGATLVAKGEPACPGVATGLVVATSEEAEDKSDEGIPVILATETTNPDDVHGMLAAEAILTEIGGSTSHAAVVSRELGRPCVVGCGAGTVTGLIGQTVTVDSTTGEVFAGALEITGACVQTPEVRALIELLENSSSERAVTLRRAVAAATTEAPGY